MAQLISSFTPTSCAYQALAATEASELVGTHNPISLPLVQISEVKAHIGSKLAKGQVGVIYEVRGIEPKRVFKFIPVERFQDGDEIRSAQVAGEIEVGPKVHASFVIQQKRQKSVAMEMDRIGRCLKQWMQALAIERDPGKAAVIQLPTLEEEEALRDELLKKAQEEAPEDSPFVAVGMPEKKRVTMERATEILYGKLEPFYLELVGNLKKLAERNIAFLDTNCGNIIPNWERDKRLQLIDFDRARVTERVSQAAEKVLNGFHTSGTFEDYSKVPGLSQESRDLVGWFVTEALKERLHRLDELLKPKDPVAP